MFAFAVLFALVLGAQQAHATIEGCQLYTADNSGNVLYFDLSPLYLIGTSYEGSFNGDEYSFYMQVCGTSTSSTACEEARGSICLYEGNGTDTFVSSLGEFNEEPSPNLSALDDVDPSLGVKITYQNGVFLNPDDIVNATVYIPCEPDGPALPGLSVTMEADIDYTQFTILMEGSQAGCATTPHIPTDPVDDGISAGTWFCIIILVSAFLYLAIGMVYKSSQMGTQGTESIPNIDFWRNLPSLVADGFSFAFNSCKQLKAGKMGGGSTQYEEV